MSKTIIDVSELLLRVENDRGLARDLLAIFKEEYPPHLDALRDAVDSLDSAQVAAEAHTLKGMLSNLAAEEAATAAARLEQLGRRGEVQGLQAAWASFDGVSKELLQQLDTCLAEAGR